MTARDAGGALPEGLEWRALVDADATTAVYMGVGTLPGLVARLLAEGLDPDTPAAMMENVEPAGGAAPASRRSRGSPRSSPPSRRPVRACCSTAARSRASRPRREDVRIRPRLQRAADRARAGDRGERHGALGRGGGGARDAKAWRPSCSTAFTAMPALAAALGAGAGDIDLRRRRSRRAIPCFARSRARSQPRPT